MARRRLARRRRSLPASFKREEGYLYFLDSNGDVSRAKRAVGGQKRKKTAAKKPAKAAKKATKKGGKKPAAKKPAKKKGKRVTTTGTAPPRASRKGRLTRRRGPFLSIRLYSSLGAVRLPLVLLIVFAACTNPMGGPTSTSQRGIDGSAYLECNTICLRPGDCEISYNDNGTCPAGFLCAYTFTCVTDGGTGG